MTVTDSAFPIGYFYIISKMNGLVIDVHDPETADVGSKIVTMQKKENSPERDSQLWIHQNGNAWIGFLTNKLSGLVLDVDRAKNFTAIFTGENHLYLDKMKEEDRAKDQRFGYDEATGFIYTLHDPSVVVDIRKKLSEEGAVVMVYDRKEDKMPANQLWSIEPADPPLVDTDDEDEDDSKRARLRAWFGQWSGWGDKKKEVLNERELNEAHEKVYTKKKAKLSHELLAGAAAYEAVKAWERKQQEEGKEVHHATAKKLIASIAAAELVKLFEERGSSSDDEDESKKEEKKGLMQRMAVSAATNYFEAKHGF
ncbi:hypothetical protein EC973_006047 [Apophysomyces ossiformis]|uniref:Uncharacterized protein n=1 Tax=Apophysomyces ossiformis TaxID=679940 RepID=A0A8H7BWP7_9FUNG|nr:hypothetical protein EC973_006047 [Apophysomyces ossiformis]